MRSELLRPRWILLHVVTVLVILVSLRLGWWQWERSQAVGGDGQNLGYAALWPAIAVFVGYVWWRWTRLELEQSAQRREPDTAGSAAPDPGTAPSQSSAPVLESLPSGPLGPTPSTPTLGPTPSVPTLGPTPSASTLGPTPSVAPPESARAAARRRQLDRLRTRGETVADGAVGTPGDALSQYNGYLAELSDSDAERARQA
ncbi:hypothetical protein [Actinoalloteichus sp. GBA129-24]|uniref:hypothetical protein n=1 Tax=Actinoalloteichus sp. GBA129-24 TaxID=1612551 RepID=UPI000950452F|nr:hypothetical protein [Actinoalloteichus sp. GBA129-24]APU22326.1 hypothetical protein UA75_21685 [Actinoalloteichus sp. GBA129-24]